MLERLLVGHEPFMRRSIPFLSSEPQRLPVFNFSFTELALLSGNPERHGRA
jgi:hypothetical protein